ncbi:MAG: ORF6N domain-containing protein [Steroidobacteraceae bacterium]
MPSPIPKADLARIVQRILIVHGQRVLLDSDLAELYGVTPKRLNEQIRRNRERFPKDFAFQLKINELRDRRSHIATTLRKYRNLRFPPLAFTEQGALMAASVLNSKRAIEMSIYVVRAFIKLRQLLASNAELARQLDELEKSITTLDARTRKQFEEVYRAIRALMAPPAAESRPIGFTADIEKER